ncbi:hypothetical protein NC797_03900 [Aquibacillus sp. 3ASR75-11]|uniref:FtsX-like permease family protein n=1 Tax=Terrihalobacillus insolitus TaxID=2950438 RepID=A0A9X4AKT5_9BACI|nr:hypothetical protein [Terrihalobacillus insolitus]MDC3423652.1 hypothetical protein [Terrihalobacillus insolitus]
MIRLAWKRIKNRKLTTIIILIAFISIFTLIPVGLDQSKTSISTVHESIAEYGRGSYDLLVRPSSSRTLIEQKLGMVEENYIGDSKGGISLKEWKKIKDDPNIEVAAPVASLGYFRGRQLSVELPVLENPTMFTYQFYTSNGNTKYPLGSKESIMYFKQYNPGFIQFLKNGENNAISSAMTVLMPENYNLLVAIDPQSEKKLTGIDFSNLNIEIKDPTLDTILQNYGNPPVMKVLQRDDLNIPIYMNLQVEQLNVNLDDYLNLLRLKNDEFLMSASTEDIAAVFKKLEQEELEKSEIFKIDLSGYQKPFDGTAILLNEKFEPAVAERYMSDADTSTYYVASKIHYQNVDNLLKVNITQNGEPPSYKDISKKGISMKESMEVPFITYQTGTFSPVQEQENHLAASPLGIYGEMKATTGDGTVLTPTTIPGSFIPSPASGVTTLENAEMIKGDKPIDAIRVKIAGITNYDEVAQKKIEKVATELLQKGYEVDVVAGSSFKKMTLDVEGIGKVNESWTTLGVAQELTGTWNVMNLLTTILLCVFGLLWLVFRLTFERHVLSQENSTLSIIGWKQSKIFLRNCVEQYMIITVAFVVSLILLVILQAEAMMYWVVIILWFVSILASTLLLNKKAKRTNRVETYKKFASIFYYKRLIIPMMLILCLSVLLISIQIAALGDAFYKSTETTLGQFIGDQTIWFQLIVTTLVVYLSIASFSEGLNTLYMERKQEFVMYHVIGWTKRKILRYIFKESTAWFLLSSLTGSIISGTILYQLGTSAVWILIGLGISFITMAIIVSIIILTHKNVVGH